MNEDHTPNTTDSVGPVDDESSTRNDNRTLPVAAVSASLDIPLESVMLEDEPVEFTVAGPTEEPNPEGKRRSFRRSLTRMSSLLKSVAFFDVESNFHGDKHMLYDPDAKFSELGEPFWRLDFKPASLTHWRPYRDNMKFLVSIGGEVILVGGFGMLYIYGLAAIPYTRESSHYYDPWMIALYYFITLLTITIVIAYGFFVMIYGFKKSMSLLWSVVLPGLVVAALPFIFLAAGIEPWFYFLDLVFYLLVGILFHISAFVMVKKVTDDKKLGKDLFMAYTTPLALHALVIALYAFVIVPYYRNIQSVVTRAIFRIIIHPIVCHINLSVATFFCKRYPRVEHQHLTTGVVFGIYVENAMFGRFLIVTVGSSLRSQIATSAAAGLLDIIIRLLVLKREHLVNFVRKRFFKVQHLNFNEAKERAYMGQFNNVSMLVEHVSILTVPFLLHAFYKHRYAFNFSYDSTETPLSVLYKSAAVQFAIQVAVHFICCVFEYLMKIPNILVWKTERRVYLLWEIANFVQIITLIVYCFKTLPATFFCDSTDPCSCSRNSYFDLNLFFDANYCT